MRYVPSVAGIFAATCLVAPHAAADSSVSAGKIDTLLLSDDDVSVIVGLPLHRAGTVSPSPPLAAPRADHDECRSFVQPDVELWSGEFSAFRQVNQQDNPDDLQFATQQFIAVYPNAKVAAQTFRHGFTPDLVSRCGSLTLTDATNAQWNVDRVSITGNRASWLNALIQNGQDTTWHCANEMQLKGNVMFEDQECQFGNGSSLAAQMTNMTASRISS